jgi:4-hydroxybenzoate polyprenyltransferase
MRVSTPSGWRAALAILLALVFVGLLLTAIFWLAIAVAVLIGVAALNWVALPRLALRLHVPDVALALALLVPLAAGGLVLAGVTGAAEGAAIWLLGVAAPRALLWRFRRRLAQRASDRERTTIILPYRP